MTSWPLTACARDRTAAHGCIVSGGLAHQLGTHGRRRYRYASAPISASSAAGGYLATLPPEHFPNLVSLAPEFAKADRDEQFELLIGIFVDGLARLAQAG